MSDEKSVVGSAGVLIQSKYHDHQITAFVY